MTELFNKEEEIYKKELKEKTKGIIDDKPTIQEEYKVQNINKYHSESFPIEKHRFDSRMIQSSNKNDLERINDVSVFLFRIMKKKFFLTLNMKNTWKERT
jgi:hypothetical protein